MRFPRPLHRAFAVRDPNRRPRVTALVLAVLVLKVAVDIWRRYRLRAADAPSA
jgi:hypothetical protein